MPFKLVVWDFDGTLVDSLQTTLAIFNRLAGMSLPADRGRPGARRMSTKRFFCDIMESRSAVAAPGAAIPRRRRGTGREPEVLPRPRCRTEAGYHGNYVWHPGLNSRCLRVNGADRVGRWLSEAFWQGEGACGGTRRPSD